jgi:hypothetical protein
MQVRMHQPQTIAPKMAGNGVPPEPILTGTSLTWPTPASHTTMAINLVH